eukprot:TRINITY_DN44927_c0_g1_i1.p1 TRINITY_DN44927_c0_g1~~TRINITY_DN44927_c0_g1_i1.p1  ORF type:complete len:471 (+),score=142.43 TRINITY_DN44927_c0_g1_i1:48-1415(+)
MDFPSWAAAAPLFSDAAVGELFREWFGSGAAPLAYALRLPPSETTARLLCARDDAPRIDAIQKSLQDAVCVGRGAARKVHPHATLPHCICVSPGPLDHLRPAAERKGEECRPPLPLLALRLVVDVRCAEAVLRGADVFCPGVLCSSGRWDADAECSVLCAVDSANVPLRGSVNSDLESAGTFVHVANGVCTKSRADVLSTKASGVGIRITLRVADHPPMDGILSDALYLQNTPSMLPPLLLKPQPGESVIDMCAAPGGKTTHVADLMGDTGRVVACDRSGKRAEELKGLVSRARLRSVEVLKLDATKAEKKFGAASFDRVLLDPPCSGLGLRPRLRHEATAPQLREFADYQKRLISTAHALLRPGGVLVYSTCTVSPWENEANVAWALGKFPDLTLAQAECDAERRYRALGGTGLPGHGLADDALQHVVRFTPTWDSADTGFFVAVLRKAERKDQ